MGVYLSDEVYGAMARALVKIARNKRPCPSGTRRLSREDQINVARTACEAIGMNWQTEFPDNFGTLAGRQHREFPS